jgi:hypothetical protein
VAGGRELSGAGRLQRAERGRHGKRMHSAPGDRAGRRSRSGRPRASCGPMQGSKRLPPGRWLQRGPAAHPASFTRPSTRAWPWRTEFCSVRRIPNSALCPPLVDARLQWPSRRTTPTRTRTPRRTSEQRRRQSRHLGCCRGGTRPPQAVFWLVRGCSSLLEGMGGQTVGLEQCITSAASPLAAVRCLACLSLQERHQAAPAPAVLQPQGVSGQHGATASGGARGWRRQRQAPRARPQLCSLPAG